MEIEEEQKGIKDQLPARNREQKDHSPTYAGEISAEDLYPYFVC